MAARALILVLAGLLAAAPVLAQDTRPHGRTDSTFIFGPVPQVRTVQGQAYVPRNSWGIDILASTNGFGAGVFYRHEYARDLTGYIDFAISEAKDNNEVDFVDYYGNSYTPGKVNRFLIFPLYFGIEHRLFADDIMDNFRPFVNAAVGPTMIYVFPYNEEYFSALGKGQTRYTIGGYVGLGSYFGSEAANVFGVNIRYYLVPYPHGLASMQTASGISSKKEFGGLYITVSFGSSW